MKKTFTHSAADKMSVWYKKGNCTDEKAVEGGKEFRGTGCRENSKFLAILLLLTVILVCSIVFTITVGSASLPVKNVVAVLKYQLFGIGEQEQGWTMAQYHIVWNIRMPRILLAALTGAGLASCGCAMQSLVLNPIADPYVLGVSSGASAGAALALIAPISVIPVTANVSAMALIGAMIASVTVYTVARLGGGGRMNPVSLILSGTAISAIMSAITNLLIFIAKNRESIASVYYWQMGSIASAEWRTLPLPAIATIAGVIILISQASKFNLLMMGEEEAAALGMKVKRFRLSMMAVVSLVVASLVSVTGIIGFVGLVIPHIVRLIARSSNNKAILPLSVVTGAVFLVWADTVARSLLGTEIPLGIITAFTGAPFFVYLMVKKRYSFGG